jgi:hypothetical protein
MLGDRITLDGIHLHRVRCLWDYDDSLRRRFRGLKFLAAEKDGRGTRYFTFDKHCGLYPIPDYICYLVAVDKKGKIHVLKGPYEGVQHFSYKEFDMQGFLEFVKEENLDESDLYKYVIDTLFGREEVWGWLGALEVI